MGSIDLSNRPFEGYTLSKIIDHNVGLFPIASTQMIKMPGAPDDDGLTIGDGAATGALSYIMPIGFTFKFNGTEYTQFLACSSGWAALIDPSTTFSSSHVVDNVSDNTTIKQTFSSNSVLLCPWFDCVFNTCNDLSKFPVYVAPSYVQDILHGFKRPPFGYDQVDYAVKYANTIAVTGERCLVIRWSSFTRSTDETVGLTTIATIKYEVVLYENGRIEFRYVPRTAINSAASSDPTNGEGATIGVFCNANGWNFRDFAVGLGHPSDTTRQLYEFGGAVYTASFADAIYAQETTTPYVSSLYACDISSVITGSGFANRHANWPGQTSNGCIMSFDPPIARRKILPRKEVRELDVKRTYPTIARTGDARLGTGAMTFDDRRTLNYTASIVDYPSTLPRSYASTEPGVVDRLNVYGNFSISSSVSRHITEQYIANEPRTFVSPFNDASHPEQSQIGEFFSGSSVDLFTDALKQPLSAKTQVQIELPLHYALTMPTTQSSMFYYNVATKGWLLPKNSGEGADIIDPTLALSSGTTYDDTGRFWPEDARGFGPIGNTVVSGTYTGSIGVGWQSDSIFGFDEEHPFDVAQQAEALMKNFGKSAQNNPNYVATDDEQFVLPINQPFLVEKVTFEMPFSAGSGWLNDKTSSTTPTMFYTGFDSYGCQPYAFDFAGPAITIALYNQVSGNLTGRNVSAQYDAISRDLITSGTIIPAGDNSKNVIIRETNLNHIEGNLTTYLFAPEGFLSFGVTPATVITSSEGTFTGSVTVNTVAGISNGVVLGQTIFATMLGEDTHASLSASAPIWADAIATNYLTAPYLSMKPFYNDANCQAFYNAKSIDALGRNEKGFSPSGRSLFGKEFVTLQRFRNNQSLPNPLYVAPTRDELPVAYKNVLSATYFSAFMQIAVPAITTMPSPYLVLPGDKLTLAISKMRPTMFTNGTYPFLSGVSAPIFRSDARHDVTLPTGSIRVTFYGSLLSNEREFHNTLNQELCTNSIHECIGSETPTDQYEVENRDAFFGTFTDDYVTGSLVTRYSVNGRTLLTTDDRGKVFSLLDARFQSMPADSPTSSYEVQHNRSKAFRQQPWYERCGEQRFVRHTTIGERYYDSMMPNICDCMTADDTPIYQLTDMTSTFLNDRNVSSKRYGTMIFDGVLEFTASINVVNTSWTRSYPFESRYQSSQRQMVFNTNMLVDHTATNIFSIGSGSSTSITPISIDEFLPIFMGAFSTTPFRFLNVASDVDLGQKILVSGTYQYVTCSMTQDDTMRTLFGFGDANTIFILSGSIYCGSNHLPTYRNVDTTISDEQSACSIAPTIRGWKYGVHSGLSMNTSAVYRRGKYGQLRDMLEQRPFTKFYQTEQLDVKKTTLGITSGPVYNKFVDADGKITKPENTSLQNLSVESTSSVPYFDCETRERTAPSTNTIDQSILTFTPDQFGNVAL